MRELLDLDRFPLDRPGDPDWNALVGRCRAALEADGMYNLDGLLHGNVAAREAGALAPRFAAEGFLHERRHNIYFRPQPGLPPEHPALREFATSNCTLCADQLTGSALLRLYEWPPFIAFLAATMSREQLHVMGDPLARVNVMAYSEGQALNWHFDRSEFTTTLLLQAPRGGGRFEYRRDLRDAADPNYEGVARLLAGADPQVRQLDLSPGTLNVFKGRNTAHRVTPVEGEHARIIAVFSYFDRPDVCFSDTERRGFYGRAG